MRWSFVALVLLSARAAWAHPPPEPPEPPDTHEYVEPEPEVTRPRIEWETWGRLAYGVHEGPANATPLAAGTIAPPPAPDAWGWDGALGADLTLGVASGGDVRIGPWIELRGFRAVAGAELALTGAPRSLDLFQYDGQGILVLRAGASDRVVTGAIAYGYLAPWRLWGPWSQPSRYMIGVRLVATATRALDDPRDWSVTGGLEVEPVGAIRYLLGIRSWY